MFQAQLEITHAVQSDHFRRDVMSEITQIGLVGMTNGFANALKDSNRVIKGSSDADFDSVVAASVDLKLDVQQVEASSKVIKVGAQLSDLVVDLIA